jgi:hypothetical protein
LSKRLEGSRSLRSIVVATLVVGAAACAVALIVRGARDLRAPSASTEAAAAPPRGQSTPAAELVRPRQIAEQVLSRNIFDSLTGSVPWEVQVAPEEEERETNADIDAGVALAGARCSGDLRLLGSVVHGLDARRSIAALRKDGKTSLMAVGERLDDLELVALYPTEAFFRRGGALCSLPVYLGASPAPPAPPVIEPAPPVVADAGEPPPSDPKRPPAFTEEELRRNIRMLGPSRFAVTRELFTRARLNPSGVSRGARFKPQERDGRALGMQVFRLRQDSLLAHLGVKQGDVLRGINGHSLSSADGVLEAFGHLGKDSRISLVLERDGARTTIEYILE